MNRPFHVIGFLALTFALFFKCQRSAISADGGTDFPNTKTVIGSLVSSGGTPSPRSKVQIVSSTYNPVADSASSVIAEDTTDGNGQYRISLADTGVYTMTAVQLDDRSRAMVIGIHVQTDTVSVDPSIMQKSGAITVALPEGLGFATGYIYVPGTTISAMVKGNGFASLDSVPAGMVSSVNYSETGQAAARVIRFNCTVAPGGVTEILYPSWRFAKQINLNTTSTGAAISGTVRGFPVLVRLSSGNFTFTQARPDGSDLRFAKNDGSPLTYEIETWDPATASAAVWVRVDTIFGNNDRQAFTMYWGNIDAAAQSAAAAVFDTSGGFQGVWHLSGPTGSAALDATANGYNGAPRGKTLPDCAHGIIGNATGLNGGNFFEMPGTASSSLNFPQHGTYSISAWVNMDSLAGEYQMIASKGDKQFNLQFKGATKNWQFTEYQDTVGWDETVCGASARSWAYLVGVRANAKQYLYVNGVCADSSIYNLPFSPSDTTFAERHGFRNTTCNFMIGKKVDYSAWFYKGLIDEVRVLSKAQSPDWIKLCYMNQRNDDMLVVIQK